MRVTLRPADPRDVDIWESPDEGRVLLDIRDQFNSAVTMHFDDWEAAQQWAHDLWEVTGLLEERHNPMVVMTFGMVRNGRPSPELL